MRKDFSIYIQEFKKGSEADASSEDWTFLKGALQEARKNTFG